MKPKIKKRWVEALRSGEYSQSKNYLKTDDKFCCLGVLTDLYVKEHNKSWGDQTRIMLSSEVSKWSGLEKPQGIYMRMNDIENKTFEEIADFIDKTE